MTTVSKDFGDVVEQILKEDKRYDKASYYFIRNALEHTLKNRKKSVKVTTPNTEHVSGQELIEGIRDYALDQFGPMAITVFENWGVIRAEDFGEVVFNLVDYGIFGKTGTDTKDDFKSAITFEEAFKMPFLSRKAKQRLADTASKNKKIVMIGNPEAPKTPKRKTVAKRLPNEESSGNPNNSKKTNNPGTEDKNDKNDKDKPKSSKD